MKHGAKMLTPKSIRQKFVHYHSNDNLVCDKWIKYVDFIENYDFIVSKAQTQYDCGMCREYAYFN